MLGQVKTMKDHSEKGFSVNLSFNGRTHAQQLCTLPKFPGFYCEVNKICSSHNKNVSSSMSSAIESNETSEY